MLNNSAFSPLQSSFNETSNQCVSLTQKTDLSDVFYFNKQTALILEVAITLLYDVTDTNNQGIKGCHKVFIVVLKLFVQLQMNIYASPWYLVVR